jgi:hypothetical protein
MRFDYQESLCLCVPALNLLHVCMLCDFTIRSKISRMLSLNIDQMTPYNMSSPCMVFYVDNRKKGFKVRFCLQIDRILIINP